MGSLWEWDTKGKTQIHLQKKILFQIPRDRRLKTDVKKAIIVLFLIDNTLEIVADQLNKDWWTHRMGYYTNIKNNFHNVSEKAEHKKLYTLHAWNFMEENIYVYILVCVCVCVCVCIEKGLEWNTLKYQEESFFGWWNYEYFYF